MCLLWTLNISAHCKSYVCRLISLYRERKHRGYSVQDRKVKATDIFTFPSELDAVAMSCTLSKCKNLLLLKGFSSWDSDIAYWWFMNATWSLILLIHYPLFVILFLSVRNWTSPFQEPMHMYLDIQEYTNWMKFSATDWCVHWFCCSSALFFKLIKFRGLS